jgi:ATP-dependent Clp protease ATP-binding subunit ClpC
VAEHELQLELSEDSKDLLVEKGWDPSMGARPLRRAIQRYIEDPLADEVLRQGPMTPGSTVVVERDAAGDEEDKPLKLRIVAPKKPPKKAEPDEPEPEKVGVGAKKDEGGEAGEPEGEQPTAGDEA